MLIIPRSPCKLPAIPGAWPAVRHRNFAPAGSQGFEEARTLSFGAENPKHPDSGATCKCWCAVAFTIQLGPDEERICFPGCVCGALAGVAPFKAHCRRSGLSKQCTADSGLFWPGRCEGLSSTSKRHRASLERLSG